MTATKQRVIGRPFKKGQSGNPAGRKPGERCAATVLGEKLMADYAEAIVRAVVKAAKAGDGVAMKLCVERLVPLRKGRLLEFDLPKIEVPADITKALGSIAEQMASGQLSPEEAASIAGVVEGQRRAIETVQFDERLRKLEHAHDSAHKA